jgi:amino acid adenylation domain-containing protein
LYISGVGLARGYLNHPELTAETFIANPFSETPGARLYKTGDRARYRADGQIEFLGRVDDQVKIRGFRIELGEIEATLTSHPAVREAAVVTRAAPSGDTRLVAYVVPQQGKTLEITDVRRFLQDRLPRYMIPATLERLPALPRTSSGKVDRQALPTPAPSGRQADHVPPRTPAEEILAGIWSDVLGRGSVGVYDDFFEIGGHSLLATQVISQVRDTFAVELPLRQLFESPTIAALGKAIDAARHQGTEPILPPIGSVSRAGALPVSFAQQRLWFLDQMEGAGSAYNMPGALRLEGTLDVAALQESLTEIVRRHEALRTTFTIVAGQALQVIHPPAPLPLAMIDLQPLPEAARDEEAQRLAGEEARLPFDLARDLLIRATLVRLSPASHVLLVTMHHIASDGWSWSIFMRELSILYDAFSQGLASPLPALPIQYADFAMWQRQWLDGDALERQLAYWRKQLAGVPALLELPTDRPRPPVKTYHGNVHRFVISDDLTQQLKSLGRNTASTLFMVLEAAFGVLLSRYSGQDDVAIGIPIANRSRSETEPLIGCFLNTLVLRNDLSGDPTFEELLRRVRRMALDAYANQDLPFEQLVDTLQPERNLSHTPLFQVMFALQNTPQAILELPGLRLQSLQPESVTAKFDLALVMEEVEGGLPAFIEYNTDLFDTETIQRLAAHFETLLSEIVAHPEHAISHFQLLSPSERRQMLIAWNETRAEYPQDRCLHQLFEAQAAQFPDAVAVVCDDRQLTYHELNRRANRLAHHLQALGVGANVPVAVCMERSLEMVQGVLAILKAGGFYVPLDPHWPEERLHRILASLEVDHLLTLRAQLPAIMKLQGKMPKLSHVLCLDVSTPRPPREGLDTETVRTLWDHLAREASDPITAAGFISSYTGQPFPEAEVDAYRDHVVELAQPLKARHRVLEIGCGSGLIAFAIAPQVGYYLGVDPSEAMQTRNRAFAAENHYTHMRFLTAFAHELGTLAEGPFDRIILASTVQFFPGPFYLQEVIAAALARLVPGGTLVIADVMDARRKDEFLHSLEDFMRQHVAEPDLHTKTHLESELYVDEDFFQDTIAELGARAEVSVLHRRHGFTNELGYRYDVIIRSSAEDDRRTPVRPRKHLWTAWHAQAWPEGNPPRSSSPEDVAYIIHTSGSTGVPKGVIVRHKPVLNVIHWVNNTFHVGPEDRLLLVASLCFDLSVYDIFGMLAAGASIHVASEADMQNSQRLLHLLYADPITFWDSAPAALQQLVPLLPSTLAVGNEPRLRLVFLSGDWIPVTLPDRIREAFPQARVVSLGGATEATVWSNYYPIEVVEPHWTSIPYGKPIDNARYYILDPHLHPCPIGVPGDLYIGGECLSDGYANDAILTASKYIPDPFSTVPGARLYKTGDLARFCSDGNMEFLGRADRQVKIRGFRIELGDVEAALAAHAAVEECVVIDREDQPGHKRLVAYVVWKRGHGASSDELRRFLRRRLPDFMVPSAFVTVTTVPLTSNGKVDRRALPPPETSETGFRTNYVAPQTPTEEVLAGIWAELLGVERVGIHDNFFELGGHSLMVTQVLARLRECLHLELPLQRLFEQATIAELGEYIETIHWAQQQNPQLPAAAADDREEIDL